MRARITPSYRSQDASLNPALAHQVATLRGAIGQAAERLAVPARFDFQPHADRPAMILTDMETGRSCVVGLCDYHGARQVLAALFGEV